MMALFTRHLSKSTECTTARLWTVIMMYQCKSILVWKCTILGQSVDKGGSYASTRTEKYEKPLYLSIDSLSQKLKITLTYKMWVMQYGSITPVYHPDQLMFVCSSPLPAPQKWEEAGKAKECQIFSEYNFEALMFDIFKGYIKVILLPSNSCTGSSLTKFFKNTN